MYSPVRTGLVLHGAGEGPNNYYRNLEIKCCILQSRIVRKKNYGKSLQCQRFFFLTSSAQRSLHISFFCNMTLCIQVKETVSLAMEQEAGVYAAIIYIKTGINSFCNTICNCKGIKSTTIRNYTSSHNPVVDDFLIET